jgi:glycosyltransferase involved in cell wall biosynthesis
MLDAWQLRDKRWKKMPYSSLIERPNLLGAACLRALTRSEADDYRAFGLTAPVAIIPNGVTIPNDLDGNEFLAEHEFLRGKRIVLFLGRIHYKKGLDILCRAWSKIQTQFSDAHLVIVGPDYENTQMRVEREIEELALGKSVTILGMRNGRRKWNALAAAHAFVLPSYSEGFSVAVLEALGCGLPVIVSRHCNFPEISERGCGWIIEPKLNELQAALTECLRVSSSQYATMSANASQLVADRYSWDRIGTLMADTYDWVLGGTKPVDVEIRANPAH